MRYDCATIGGIVEFYTARDARERFDGEKHYDSMAETLNDFVRELAGFVGRESDTVRRYFHAQWPLPVAERVAAGRCAEGLEFVAVKEERFLVFRCVAENGSDLREGDLVRPSRSEPALPLLTGSLRRGCGDLV